MEDIDSVIDLALDDLDRSGLGDEAEALGIEAFTAAYTYKLSEIKTPSYKIPYFNVDGSMRPFYRLRLLQNPGRRKKLDIRYWQASGSEPMAYLAPFQDWTSHLGDKTTLFITEGEKKAACACMMGIPTIGLGGVWSWKSTKKQIPFIRDLAQFEWQGRDVSIVYDSDIVTNMKVQAAMVALATKLSALGATPSYILLPSSGKKVGLDDYLLDHSAEEFLALERHVFLQHEQIVGMNKELAYMEKPGDYYHIPTDQFFSYNKLLTNVYPGRKSQVMGGNGSLVEVPTVKLWAESALRRVHPRMVFKPGQPEVLDDGSYNRWKGWAVEPIEGDVSMWEMLWDVIFYGAEPAHRKWAEQWCAYPLQHPGIKMKTSMLIHGIMHGNGKTAIGYTLQQIYGRNSIEIKNQDLHSIYNPWAKDKQFIIANEISNSFRKEDSDRLKQIISQDQVLINEKYQAHVEYDDAMNYYLTSNHADAIYLEKYDRRFFIHNACGPRPPEKFYTDYHRWRYTKEGIGAVFHHLLTVDLTGFNPHGDAPVTKSKDDMRFMVSSEVEIWASDLEIAPDQILGHNNYKDVFTAKELLHIYDPANETRVAITGLGKALAAQGFEQKRIKAGGKSLRLWIVKNVNKWKSASIEALLEEHNKQPTHWTKS